MEKIGFTKYQYSTLKVEICNTNEELIFVNNIRLHPQSISQRIIELLESGEEEKALTGILEYEKNIQGHLNRIYKTLP